MKKRKTFGISAALNRGFSETISIAENSDQVFRNAVIPLSRLQLDPENPRKLHVTEAELMQGIKKTDPLYQIKTDELEKLQTLANTIQAKGLISPIAVYKLGDHYRVVAGNRRSLAAKLAGKQEIEARVFNQKPDQFDLKLIQWIENTAREDLSLFERLENIRTLMAAYLEKHKRLKLNPKLLTELTGISLSQAKNYCYVLTGPQDILDLIQAGEVNNLDKAVLLANIADPNLRKRLLQANQTGASLRQLKHLLQQQRQESQAARVGTTTKRGRIAQRIHLGTTKNPLLIKAMVDAICQQARFKHLNKIFIDLNWQDFNAVNRAFAQFIRALETIEQ